MIVLSSLGYGKFDEEDQRLLEVLASHAAVAFENAKLFQAEREAAETSAALLATLADAHAACTTVGDILQEASRRSHRSVPVLRAVGAYVRDAETGDFRLARLHEVDRGTRPAARRDRRRPARGGRRAAPERVPTRSSIPDDRGASRSRAELCIVQRAPRGTRRAAALGARRLRRPRHGGAPGARAVRRSDLRLARGLADITSLALGNARRLSELERFHELVESLRRRASGRRTPRTLAFTFLGGRAEDLLGPTATAGGRPRGGAGAITSPPRTASEAMSAMRAASDRGRTRSLEYRVARPDGEHGLDPRPGARRAGAQGTATAPRSHGRRHRAQARRAGAARERAQVLGGVPAGTRGRATPPCARRDEEHVPGGGLARPPDPAHLDPRFGAHARADAVRAAARGRARPGAPDRRERPQARAAAVRPARPRPAAARASSRPSDVRPTSRRSCAGASTRPRTRAATRSRSRSSPSRCRSTPPRSSGSSRTSCRTRSGTRPPGTTDLGPSVGHRTAACCWSSRTRARACRADLHEAVFEPFRQAPGSSSEHSPGVGVGLSLVRRFAELHGGRAWLEDRAGGGASFHVFLPGG